MKLYKSLKLDLSSCKPGSFRALPKIHKPKFSIRPIINCVGHLTSNLCYLIDIILKPFVINSSSYLKDSQQLLQEAENLVIPPSSKLYSCDFDSLYTNINLNDALNLISDFIRTRFHSSNIDIIGFRKILEIIFKYNIFKFNKSFYKQVKGIAMGSKCGPSIANVFVLIYETIFLTIHRPIYYKRFIDDIFIIVDENFDIYILISSFGSLKLNVVTDFSVNFLDLWISICKITRSLKFKMYIKPTNTFCYVPTSSNHPSSIFLAIPKSVLLRPRRICSYFSDFLYYARLILFQLISRGYDFETIRKVINMISNLDRSSLIKYKEKEQFHFHEQIIFKMPFDFNFINIKSIIINSFNNIKTKYIFLKEKKLRIIYSMEPNLGRLLVHNFKLNYDNLKLFHFSSCFDLNCKTCIFADSGYFIKFNEYFSIPLYINSSCDTTGIVYIIKCNLCPGVFYIGESGKTVKKRISAHINKIKNFVPFSYHNTNVSKHFNLIGHNYLHHFRFFIFIKNCDDKSIRRNYENQLLNIFKNMKKNLINDSEDLNRNFDLFCTKIFRFK